MRLRAQFVGVLLVVGLVGAYLWWILAALESESTPAICGPRAAPPALRPRARGRDRLLPADESKGCRVERHRCALALQLFERDGQSVAAESAEVEQHTGLIALCPGVVARRHMEDGTGREFDDRAVLHADGHPPR